MKEAKEPMVHLVLRAAIYLAASLFAIAIAVVFVVIVVAIGKSFDLSAYLWAKLTWALVVVVGIGLATFFYGLFTGKDLRDKFRERPPKR